MWEPRVTTVTEYTTCMFIIYFSHFGKVHFDSIFVFSTFLYILLKPYFDFNYFQALKVFCVLKDTDDTQHLMLKWHLNAKIHQFSQATVF